MVKLRDLLTPPPYAQSATMALSKKSLLALVTRLAPGLATFVTNVAIGRLGGSPLLGTTQSIISAASLSSLFYPTAAGTASSRFISAAVATRSHEEAQAIARYLALRVGIFSGALAVIAVAVFAFNPRWSPAAGLTLGLMVVAIGGRAFVEGLHFGGGEGQRLAIWSLLVASLSTVATGTLLLAGVRSALVIVPLGILNLTFLALSWPRRASAPVRPELRHQIRRFIVIAVIGTLASAGFAQATILVANVLNGVVYAGEYAAAVTLTTPFALAATALSAVLFPAMAAAHGTADRIAIRTRVENATSLLTTALVGGLLLVLPMTGPLVGIVWGADFPDTVWIMLFLLPATAAGAIAVPSVSAITSSSNRGMAISAGASVAGASAGALTWVLVLPTFPQVGVPLGYAVGAILIAVIPMLVTWRMIRPRWWRDLTSGAIGAVAAVGCAYAALRTGADWWISLTCGALLAGTWALLRRRSIATLARGLRRAVQ